MKFVVAMLAAAAMVWAWPASAQFAVSVFGISKHSKPGFCEVNPGQALNYDVSADWRLLAGRYQNSQCHPTNALGAVYCGLHWGNFCFGTALLRLTGYKDKAIYAPLPVISYERGSYAIDAIVGAKDGEYVIGLGVRFPL